MATIYTRLLNQYKFKFHIMFSASFHKINKEDQGSDETELSINLNINYSLTESDTDNLDVKSQLEHQFEIQETKESGWIIHKIKIMKIRFRKTGELNGSSYVKTNIRMFCFNKY